MRRMRALILLLLSLALACSDRGSAPETDAGGGVDAGRVDVGAGEDAATGDDAGSDDAGSADDAGGADGGDDGSDGGPRPDAAPQDAGPPDAGGRVDVGSGRGVSCDHRDIRCRIPEPLCPEGEIASVEGSCYGPCVPIEECVCETGEECPRPEMWTCHRHVSRCGPYL